MGVLFSFALPKFTNYQQSACITKIQLQVFNFKLALKKQIAQPNNPNIDLMEPVSYKNMTLPTMLRV